MTEIEDIQRDLKAIHKRFTKWYNDNIMSIHYEQTYPYILTSSNLGGAVVALDMIVRHQKKGKGK